jgi:tetratricopeptide (TPR) repeat protein
MRGTVLWNVGQLHAAIDSFAEALVIYRMLGHRRPEARVLNNMGIVFAELQELEEALAHYKSSLKLDQELGDRSAIPLKLGNIGQTYTDLGDTQRGEQYLVKALKLAEQNDDERTAADAVISLGQVYLHKRQPRRALELFERGHHLATAAGGERYQEIRSLIYIALASIEAGEPAGRALELGESAAALARAVPMPVGEIFALGAQALALCALGRGSEAAARSTRAVELQAASHQPEGSEQILHIHARACAAAGRPEAARAALRQAMDHIEAKAARLRDPELRATYLAAPVPAAVAAELERVEP